MLTALAALYIFAALCACISPAFETSAYVQADDAALGDAIGPDASLDDTAVEFDSTSRHPHADVSIGPFTCDAATSCYCALRFQTCIAPQRPTCVENDGGDVTVFCYDGD